VLIIASAVKKLPAFMESETTTYSLAHKYESSLHSHIYTFHKMHFNIILPSTRKLEKSLLRGILGLKRERSKTGLQK
jgi:hypothetical protein